ncbi:MAG: hypothetical protein L0154_26420 [Chloroflexi bacterium]|nr:hypothetical protein [Chloroflexota bacterium]
MSREALDRYHARYDQKQYMALQKDIAHALRRSPDDKLTSVVMNRITDTALELCNHPAHEGAHLELAIVCQAYHLPLPIIDGMHEYLQGYTTGQDIRLTDFRAIAKALHTATNAFDDLRASSLCASAIHSWQGRCAHHLLVAAEHLTLAARHLLMGKHDGYVKEKLTLAEERVTMAQQEGPAND